MLPSPPVSITPQQEATRWKPCGTLLSLRVPWSLQKPLPLRWPGRSLFLTGEGPILRASRSSLGEQHVLWLGGLASADRETFPFSKLLLAGRRTSSWSLPLRPPVGPAHSLTSVGEGGEGQEEWVFVIPLREKPLELRPVSWSGPPLRMP